MAALETRPEHGPESSASLPPPSTAHARAILSAGAGRWAGAAVPAQPVPASAPPPAQPTELSAQDSLLQPPPPPPRKRGRGVLRKRADDPGGDALPGSPTAPPERETPAADGAVLASPGAPPQPAALSPPLPDLGVGGPARDQHEAGAPLPQPALMAALPRGHPADRAAPSMRPAAQQPSASGVRAGVGARNGSVPDVPPLATFTPGPEGAWGRDDGGGVHGAQMWDAHAEGEFALAWS